MNHVGLDAHAKQSTFHVLDDRGRKVMSRKVIGGVHEVIGELRKIDGPFDLCFEASCGYGHWFESLSTVATRVQVAHPGHLRLIFRSKRKNDRVDAEKLAKLLYLDVVPGVHVPKAETREWRALIQFRQRDVAGSTRVKNAIRAHLRTHGIKAPTGLWTKKGIAWLKSLELPGVLARVQLRQLLSNLEAKQQSIKEVTKVLDVVASKHPGVQLLRTIPGIGPRTAEAVVAWIDKPHRFRHNKQIGAYFGVVPCEDTSAGRHRLGHITKDGPGAVRHLVVEATWQAIRRCPAIRDYHRRIMKEDPDRKKIALVATAHYLLRVMLAMLQTGEVWREA